MFSWTVIFVDSAPSHLRILECVAERTGALLFSFISV
jgi:hypothetical protein